MGFSALMFLHRKFFGQALADNPTNPLESTYGHSFITAYNSACEIVDSTGSHYDKQLLLVPRLWRIWTYAFSAAVGIIICSPIVQFEFEFVQTIIGAAAIRTLNSGFEPSPLEKLGYVCRLFQRAAETSSPALRALVSTLVLKGN